jgi:hypothetical protein
MHTVHADSICVEGMLRTHAENVSADISRRPRAVSVAVRTAAYDMSLTQRHVTHAGPGWMGGYRIPKDTRM